MFSGPAVDLGRVSSVPRPLLALLAATILVFALYTVALKPATPGAGGGSNPGAYQSAIAKARGVQGLVNGAAVKDGGAPTPTTPPSSPTRTSSTLTNKPAASQPLPAKTTPAPATQHPRAPSSHVSHAKGAGAGSVASLAGPGTVVGTITPHQAALTAAERFHAAQIALEQHKVLALLFYNPASADDRAVESEMSSIPTHGGAVVKLAVPVQELAAYSDLLNQVPVNYSPTLMLIDRNRQAEEIAGYASSFEIDQRVAEALRS